MADSSSKTVVYAALAGNLLVALTKGVAAALSGSSSMLSEAVHSLVDTGNELLLLYGMHRAAKAATPEHPIGYGRELYFWSFIVAVLIFALGAGVSIFEGVSHIRNPEPVERAWVNYAVLGLAFVFEGVSWVISLRQYRAAMGDLGFFEAFRKSKDPPSFMVFFEDSAALVGIVLAAAGTYASDSLDLPVLDGAASIAIGLVLAVVAVLLARESKSLLIGERADRALSDSILRVAGEVPSVARANGLITVQMAPDQVVAMLSLEFADELRTPEIEKAVTEIEQRVRQAHPEVVSLFVKPQTHRTYLDKLQELEAGR
ncbi:cation diffusion facilitator family transporter [Caenimonas terrae]|uniref:Cation diffusion facilitator family transporter n=1 Tax=Caenimonas terrae TaxID=696074 RepID=A0ABW0N8P2_9BURK